MSEHEVDQNKVTTNGNDWAKSAIKQWIKARNIRFEVSSDSFFMDQVNFSIPDLARAARAQVQVGKRRLTQDASIVALRDIARETRVAALDNVIETLIVSARTDDKALRTWLKALLHEDMGIEEFENCVTVVKQWLWLVQRSLLGKEQQWHIMPIFWGGQGGGKSTQIARLLAPLGSFWAKNTFQVMMGQFDALPMHRNYALFLDEMEKADRASASRVKMCVDAKYIPGRAMYSDEGRSLLRNASFIAATNEPPPHGLMDPTGGRRFYSLECRTTPMLGERAEFFNKTDYLAIWRCVDPNSEAPMLERREQISKIQNDVNRAPAPLERFLREGCVEVPGQDLSLTEFRDGYKEYCLRCGLRFSFPPQPHAISQLESLGVVVKNHSSRFVLKNLAVAP